MSFSFLIHIHPDIQLCITSTLHEARNFVEKLIVAQMVKNFAFYKTRRFITKFTGARQFFSILSQVNSVHTLTHCSLGSILISSCHLHLVLPSDFWHSPLPSYMSRANICRMKLVPYHNATRRLNPEDSGLSPGCILQIHRNLLRLKFTCG
jgi:hypothetical protein